MSETTMAFPQPRKTRTVYREKSMSVAKLMPLLAKAMAEFTPVVRDCEGEVVRNGKRQKYRYASHDSINKATKAALLKHGVVPLQEYTLSEAGITLVTSLNYGDEFLSSALPIRQYEDSQRMKAHMSYMRRTALEGLLCLSAEDDADGADDQPVEVVDNKVWAAQQKLAKDAISAAATDAQVASILAKVRKKIADGDMDPHHLGSLEELGDKRIAALKETQEAVAQVVAGSLKPQKQVEVTA